MERSKGEIMDKKFSFLRERREINIVVGFYDKEIFNEIYSLDDDYKIEKQISIHDHFLSECHHTNYKIIVDIWMCPGGILFASTQSKEILMEFAKQLKSSTKTMRLFQVDKKGNIEIMEKEIFIDMMDRGIEVR